MPLCVMSRSPLLAFVVVDNLDNPDSDTVAFWLHDQAPVLRQASRPLSLTVLLEFFPVPHSEQQIRRFAGATQLRKAELQRLGHLRAQLALHVALLGALSFELVARVPQLQSVT